jgi:hypothetical protein
MNRDGHFSTSHGDLTEKIIEKITENVSPRSLVWADLPAQTGRQTTSSTAPH